MSTMGSTAAVLSAVREEAAAEAEAAERRLAASAPAPTPEVGDAPDEAGATRLAAARRAARERLAREDWLDTRAALEAREAWIARVVAEGRRRLGEGLPPAERAAMLTAAARAALARLPGARVVVTLAPGDAPLVDATALGGAGRAVTVVSDSALPPGSCVARSEDGRLALDNGVDARAHRLESEWRAALGKVYGT